MMDGKRANTNNNNNNNNHADDTKGGNGNGNGGNDNNEDAFDCNICFEMAKEPITTRMYIQPSSFSPLPFVLYICLLFS
jgi:hypothetical protein